MKAVAQLVMLTALVGLFVVVIVLALRCQVVGALLALAGVAGIGWGSWYLYMALLPENRSNELRDFGIAFGVAVILGGGLLLMLGAWTMSVAARRKRAPASVEHP